MTDVEQIARKVHQLDPARLQILSEFVDFLLTRGDGRSEERGFPETSIEDPAQPSVYKGKPLSLDAMREAVNWEAGEHR